jgi:hypothetical protein
MSDIDHIQFNNDIYQDAENCSLLLCEMRRVGPVIQLPDAAKMTFIRVFLETSLCQNYINNHPGNIAILFGYDQNMQPWLADDINMLARLEGMKIFCHSDYVGYVMGWTHLYQLRLNIAIDICTFEDLNEELLRFGCRYIRTLRQQFENNNDIYNQLNDDYNAILATLRNNAINRALAIEQN